jgi:hypothetical protein
MGAVRSRGGLAAVTAVGPLRGVRGRGDCPPGSSDEASPYRRIPGSPGCGRCWPSMRHSPRRCAGARVVPGGTARPSARRVQTLTVGSRRPCPLGGPSLPTGMAARQSPTPGYKPDPPFSAPAVSLQELVCAAPNVAFCVRTPMMPAATPACAPDLDRIAGRQLKRVTYRMRGRYRYQALPNLRTPLMPAGQPAGPASAPQ